jgi:hypothetical protein
LELDNIKNRWLSKLWLAMGSLAACTVFLVEIEEDEQGTEMDIELIPNKELLTPEALHPAHKLHQGLLLDLTTLKQ